jgi:Family of unknown function (DUF5701)
MSDTDEFAPISSIKLPNAPLYVIRDLDRGDAMANWSPDEALPAIADAAMGLPSATRRKSAGAGRETGIPGSDSPRPVAENR